VRSTKRGKVICDLSKKGEGPRRFGPGGRKESLPPLDSLGDEKKKVRDFGLTFQQGDLKTQRKIVKTTISGKYREKREEFSRHPVEGLTVENNSQELKRPDEKNAQAEFEGDSPSQGGKAGYIDPVLRVKKIRITGRSDNLK